jgi:hypothetical protein
MKALFSSSDLTAVGQLVKRLLFARIPCAVCKDPGQSYFSVWVQQDIDFAGALGILLHRAKSRSLPHWASALEFDPGPSKGLASLAGNRTGTGSSPVSRSGISLRWSLADPVPKENAQIRGPLMGATRFGTSAPPACLSIPDHSSKHWME